MLNGIAPLLLFEFTYFPPTFSGVGPAEAPNAALLWAQNTLGVIPVPILLLEKLTKIFIDTESSAIDIETDVQPRYDKDPVTGLPKPPLVSQRGVSSMVTVNMLASKDSVMLTVLLALADQILQRTVSQEYKVSYFNGPTAIFRGLLHGFQTSVSSEDDLVRITMQIQKPAPVNNLAQGAQVVLPKVVAALPG